MLQALTRHGGVERTVHRENFWGRRWEARAHQEINCSWEEESGCLAQWRCRASPKGQGCGRTLEGLRGVSVPEEERWSTESEHPSILRRVAWGRQLGRVGDDGHKLRMRTWTHSQPK